MIVIPLIKRLIRIINIIGSRIVATTRSHGTGLIQQALEIIQADTVLRVGGAGHKVDKGVFRNLSMGGGGLNFSVQGGGCSTSVGAWKSPEPTGPGGFWAP